MVRNENLDTEYSWKVHKMSYDCFEYNSVINLGWYLSLNCHIVTRIGISQLPIVTGNCVGNRLIVTRFPTEANVFFFCIANSGSGTAFRVYKVTCCSCRALSLVLVKLTHSRHLCMQCHQLAGSLCSVVWLSQEECLCYGMNTCERMEITLVQGGRQVVSI
jgi:hypothetical protein